MRPSACAKQNPYTPSFVRQFYTHFDHANNKAGVIHTWVKGKSIELDEAKLGEILGLSRGI